MRTTKLRFEEKHLLFVIYPFIPRKLVVKVDREDHFERQGFLHIIICAFLGYKASNFVKESECYRCSKSLKI